MKSCLIFIGCFVYASLFCAETNAQNVYNRNKVNCNIDLYCTTLDGTPVTGLVKEYYGSGALLRETNYKDGKKNGLEKYYDVNGNLMEGRCYKNGKYVGCDDIYYTPDGEVFTEEQLEENKYTGVAKWYYGSGALLRETNYKDGKQNGLEKEYDYYESGALRRETNYKDNKKNGLEKGYYESGTLEYEINYKDGKINGLVKMYYENGDLSSVDCYRNDNRYACNIYYTPDGEVFTEEQLEENKYTGVAKLYYKSGVLKEKSNWKNGQQNGISIYYDEKGKFIQAYKYIDGQIHSDAVLYYDEDGNITGDAIKIKNPYMKYAYNSDISRLVGSDYSSIALKKVGDNAFQELRDSSMTAYRHAMQALSEISDKRLERYGVIMYCEKSQKKKQTYYEYDEDCKIKFLRQKDMLYIQCVQQTSNMSGMDKMFYFNQECIENIANNGYLERCKREKEGQVDTCEGEKKFIIHNGYGKNILEIPTLSQPNLTDIPYSRIVRALYEKYGAATYTQRGIANASNIFETFYWVDGDWILRAELALSDDQFNDKTKVDYISTMYVNPKAYAAQITFLQEEKQRKIAEQKAKEEKMKKEQEERIENFKL